MSNQMLRFQVSTSFLRFLLNLSVLFIPLWPPYILIKFDKFPAIDLPRFIIFTLVLIWIVFVIDVRVVSKKLKDVYQHSKYVFISLFAFFLWELISAISSHSSAAIMATVRDIIFFFFIFLVSASILDNCGHIDNLLRTILLATFIVSIIGLIEIIVSHNIFAHLATTDLGDALQLDKNQREGSRRISATFIHSLALANWICIALPTTFYILTRSSNYLWKVFATISLPLALLVLYFTRSRVGLLVCLFEVFIITLFMFNSLLTRVRPLPATVFLKFMRFLVITAAVLFFFFMALTLLKGTSASEATSTAARGAQYFFAIPLILSNPLYGYGQTEAAKLLGVGDSIDNYFLSLILESGIPAAIFFVIILILAIVDSVRMYRARGGFSIIGGMLGLTLTSNIMFLSVSSLEDTLSVMFIFIGSVCAIKTSHSKC